MLSPRRQAKHLLLPRRLPWILTGAPSDATLLPRALCGQGFGAPVISEPWALLSPAAPEGGGGREWRGHPSRRAWSRARLVGCFTEAFAVNQSAVGAERARGFVRRSRD
jgi:hypothetical protein